MKRTRTTALALVLAAAVGGSVTGVAVAAPNDSGERTTCSQDCTGDGTGRAGGGGRWGGDAGVDAREASGSDAGSAAWRGGRGGGTGAGNGSGSGNGSGTGSGLGSGNGSGSGIGSGSGSGSGNGSGAGSGSGSGASSSGRGDGAGSPLPPPIEGATVSSEVAAQLLYLVEEEKLAGDIYQLAGDLYGDRVFTNIAAAEDRHADEVRELLQRYGLTDPTDARAGVFASSQLQELYDDLAATVERSRDEAIGVGVQIEELDIDDLQALLADSGDLPDDVVQVAENLLSGSQRHLAAFQRQA